MLAGDDGEVGELNSVLLTLDAAGESNERAVALDGEVCDEGEEGSTIAGEEVEVVEVVSSVAAAI